MALVQEVKAVLRARETRKLARRPADAARYDLTVEVLIANLIHRALETDAEGWLVVTRGRSQKRRAGDLMASRAFPPLLDALNAVGLIEQRIGKKTPLKDYQEPTVIRIGPALLKLAEASGGIGYDDLREETADRELVVVIEGDLQEGPEVDAIRADVAACNAIWAAATIELDPSVPLKRPAPDLRQRHAHRQYKRDLQTGGRYVGPFWLNMAVADREAALVVDGEHVASLDYGQIGLRILYARIGVPPPPGDLYAIPGLEGLPREDVKSFINAVISAEQRLTQWPRSVRLPGMKASEALALVAAHHPAIAHLFGLSGWGPIQNVESEVITRVVLYCGAAGFTALPIHDCVLVPRSRAEEARRIMLVSFTEVTGASGIPIKPEPIIPEFRLAA